MQLEFHQLERRGEHLRVQQPQQQKRLLASLAGSGQQTPIVVVPLEGEPDRYVVIDGYKRIAALQQLGRDTVEAVVWAMTEAEALVLNRSSHWSQRESALEEGWLLADLQQRFGYSIQDRNLIAHDGGQIQLPGFVDLCLLALGDIAANALGDTLYRFGGHRQAGQHLNLLPAVIEWSLLSDQSMHAPHARREVAVLNVQFAVGGELALVTMRTQIPGAHDCHLPHSGHYAPRAQLAVARLMTAATGDRALLGRWWGEPQ